MSTSQFCQMFVRPFTSRSRGSLTQQLLARADTAHHVGDSTWFISHTWGNSFLDTLDAILLFFEGQPGSENDKVWFDVFAASQHATSAASKPSLFWMNKFKENIAHIGRLLLVVDKWDNPTALRRAWYAAAATIAFQPTPVVLQVRAGIACNRMQKARRNR